MMAILRGLVSILLWPLAAVFMWIAKFIGLFLIPIALWRDWDMAALKIWGNDEGLPAEYDTGFLKRWWWYAVRNGAHNLYFGIMPYYFVTYGDSDMESRRGFQWRWRQAGWLSSFRLTWGEPHRRKGKNEFYIGFKLTESSPYVKVTFFQLRPAYLILIPVVIWTLL